jgi:murein DD-endopeptidase MepM/ murein hydrolase activator NlpD
MIKTLGTTLLLLPLFFSASLFAQQISEGPAESGGANPTEQNDAAHPCITPEQYEIIEKQCAENIKLLKLGQVHPDNLLSVPLSWPLKAAAGFNDCSFYTITAYVDHDATTGLKDWNCGTNTYDGHKGTDIAIWPLPFYKMDNNQVEVIAAAPGTIINKSDGNFDKNCGTNNLTANYLVIQHADGSTVLYFHMKKNSLTAKVVGQTVATGEYLGVVGSSGNSSGPHLHFELWAGSTVNTLNDPWSGTCNNFNANSWWVTQKPYTEPAVIKASVHITDVVFPACPATETPNESKCYPLPFQGPGLSPGYAKFYIFFRNETAGMMANMSILNPDGTTFNSWTYTSNTSYNASSRSFSKLLPTIAGTYTFKAVYNGTTCSQTFDVMTATITPSGPTAICQGNSVTLTANPGTSYLWSNGATTQSTSASTAGGYTVTVTNAHGCSAVSPTVNVTVNPPPAASVAADGPTTFCQGGSVHLTAGAATGYVWSNGATSQSITASSSGLYTVTVSNATGCTAAAVPVAITVNPLPIAMITPGGPTTFCQGGSVVLMASAAGSYAWSTGATAALIAVSVAGNYKVTLTNASGCTAVTPVTSITVNPLPVATITPGGPTTFCQGGSVVLTASASGSYAWNTGATTAGITVSTTGNYQVTLTNASGCTAAASATSVTVNPLPVASITAGGPTTFCPGGSVMLTAGAANTYFWSNGITTQHNTVSVSGNFAVTVSDANGCTAVSAPASVMVYSNPVATISANGLPVFCQGQSIMLGAGAAAAYLWSTGATTQDITVSVGGNYTVQVTDVNGCKATSAVLAITVNPLPVATITASGSTTFCQGSSVVLTAGAASQYTWSNGATTQSTVVSVAGSYVVTVTNVSGCTASASPETVSVTIPQNGLAIQLKHDSLIAPYSLPVYWYVAGNLAPIDSGSIHHCKQTGDYHAVGQDANGCAATSGTLHVVCNPSSTGTVDDLSGIRVYPNPAMDFIYVDGVDIENGVYIISLKNMIGQVVLSEYVVVESNTVQKHLALSNLPAGLYLLSIERGQKSKIIKVVKMN